MPRAPGRNAGGRGRAPAARGAAQGRGRGAGGRGAGAEVPPPEDPIFLQQEVGVVLHNLDFPMDVIQNIVVANGLGTLRSLLLLQEKSITKLFDRLDTLGVHYTVLHMSLFRAIVHYNRRQRKINEGILLTPFNFTIEVLSSEIDLMEDPTKTPDAKNKAAVLARLPEKFTKDTKWRAFRDEFLNYLDSQKGAKNVPLTYVVRPDVRPGDVPEDDPVYSTDHQGDLFKEDNRSVFTILQGCVFGGPGEVYLRSFANSKNGRAAFKNLDEMFSQGSYSVLKINTAWATIYNAQYTGNRASFDFNTYRRILDDAWRDLLEARQTVDAETKIHFLFRGMTHPDFKAIKAIAQNDNNLIHDYEKTCNMIARSLANDAEAIVPRAKPVGVSQTTSIKRLSREEWNKLSDAQKTAILDARKTQHVQWGAEDRREGGRGGRGNRNSGRGGQRGRGGGRRENRFNDGHFSGSGRHTSGNRTSAHGQNSGRGSYQHRRVSAFDAHTADTGGRYFKQDLEEDDDFEPYEFVYDVDAGEDPIPTKSTTRNARRRSTSSVRFDQDGPGGYKYRKFSPFSVRHVSFVTEESSLRAELDSHADHCVLGSEAVVLEEYLGETFKVYGYNSQSCSEKHLVKACLGYVTDSGETIILVFDKVFYEPTLGHSLLNPNQLRDVGIIVEDTPTRYDPRSKHRIVVPDPEIVIPLKTHGYISYIPIVKPTDDDIAQCTHVMMTGSSWDPHSEDFAVLESLATSSVAPVSSHSHAIDPRILAKRLFISEQAAAETLKITTVLASRVYDEPRYTRYGHRFRWLGKQFLSDKWYTDTFFAKESLAGHTAVQLFVNQNRFVYMKVMRSKAEAPYALRMFIDHVGIPELLISDNSKEQRSQAWTQVIREFNVRERPTEPYKAWQNLAENGILMIKLKTARIMEQQHVPIPLWDHALEYAVAVSNRTFHPCPRLEGRTPHEMVYGSTPDISPFVQFGFYDYVFYTVMPRPKFPEARRKIGRFLGPSKATVSDLAFKVLTQNGFVVVTAAVEPVTKSDTDNESIKGMLSDYTTTLNTVINRLQIDTTSPSQLFNIDYESIEEDLPVSGKKPRGGLNHTSVASVAGIARSQAGMANIQDDEAEYARVASLSSLHTANVRLTQPGEARIDYRHTANIKMSKTGWTRVNTDDDNSTGRTTAGGRNDMSPPTHGWDGARVRIPRGDGTRTGTVLGRKRNAEGDILGTPNENPILDSTIYQVRFNDDAVEDIASNTIAESLYRESDNEGRTWLKLDRIIEHFKTSRAPTDPKFKSTKGWFFLVRWDDGREDLIRLSEIKESYPLTLARYVMDKNLQHEAAFSWWVRYTLKHGDRIISKIRARNVRNEKFGIAIPRTVSEALAFDRQSGTSYWADAIQKEMDNVAIAFNILQPGARIPPGYQFIRCHMIFDLKSDGTRKARYVADGHRTETPSSITYSSVVSRDSIRILFVIAALNGLSVLSTDIRNAYLNAKPREKVAFVAGPEFKDKEGCVVVVVRALYGLKSSGAAFRSHLASILRELGFISSLADPDVWLRERTTRSGHCYYEYICCYVDDIICFSANPSEFMEQLKQIFTLKDGYNSPKTFLGAEVHSYELHDNLGRRSKCFGLGSKAYLENIIKELETRLAVELQICLPNTAVSPIRADYRPENDTTPLLNDHFVQWYQGLVGTLRWLTEIGRIDVAFAVSLMSSYAHQPREGHFLEVLHIFGYLRKKMGLSLMLNHLEFHHKKNISYDKNEWSDFYHGATESLPPNAPTPRGFPVSTTVFVDADHGGDTSTRRSHSGILIYVQNAPVIWYSKKQATVESSTHGAELVATRIAVEMMESLRYKLRMFGVPLDGPSIVYCDNHSVVHNGSRPESVLRKKHNSISFHKIREAVAAGYIEIHKISTTDNLADLLTKPLSGIVTEKLTSQILVEA